MKAADFSSVREYWRAMVSQQKLSGLSQSKFCEEKMISRSSFYSWVATFKKEDTKSNFARVKPTSAKDFETKSEMITGSEKSISNSLPVKIEFKSGATLHFAGSPDPEWIAEILKLVS